MLRTLPLLFIALMPPPPALADEDTLEPGEPIDYSKLAFYPERWKERGMDLELVPWEGEHIAFLTIGSDYGAETMGSLVKRLDSGWSLYRELTGRSPRPFRVVNGKATIAAVPGGLTCGYGCGYLGATGIEMTDFYGGHLGRLQKDPKDVPHAYFYEMGRNYYTFGNRHSCFTTGFAVFMRYVCMDALELNDTDRATRAVIEAAIAEYEKSDLSFLPTFTNAHGPGEKENRLKSRPTDQPVMYASAMLHLKDELPDKWLAAFFRQIATCPNADPKTEDGSQSQAFYWFLAASCAAKKNLSPIFVDRWRLELTSAQKEILQSVDWDAKDLEAGGILSDAETD